MEIRDLGRIMIPNNLTLEKMNSTNSENMLKNKCEDSRKTEFFLLKGLQGIIYLQKKFHHNFKEILPSLRNFYPRISGIRSNRK